MARHLLKNARIMHSVDTCNAALVLLSILICQGSTNSQPCLIQFFKTIGLQAVLKTGWILIRRFIRVKLTYQYLISKTIVN